MRKSEFIKIQSELINDLKSDLESYEVWHKVDMNFIDKLLEENEKLKDEKDKYLNKYMILIDKINRDKLLDL
jgi:hypothetical protein